MGKTYRAHLTIGDRYCISFLSGHRRGRPGEELGSQMPVDGCARGHGRARVNKPSALCAPSAPLLGRKLVSALTPPSSLSAAEAFSHLGAPGVKGLRGIAIVNAGNGELCAWATCNAHQPNIWMGCVPCVPVHDQGGCGKSDTELPPRPFRKTWANREGKTLNCAGEGP